MAVMMVKREISDVGNLAFHYLLKTLD